MEIYRVYCETCGWHEVESENPPTECPTDSEHELRDESTSIVVKDE